MEVIGRPRHVIRTQVPQVLDLVGLAKKAGEFPNELSGGEQQRVSIARAFVNRPLILLADEPTGNLDPATTVGIMQLLDRINRTGTTVVMATHDQRIVDAMRRRVIELDQGHARPRPGPRHLRRRARRQAPDVSHDWVTSPRDADFAPPQPAHDDRRASSRRDRSRRSAARCCCSSAATTAQIKVRANVQLADLLHRARGARAPVEAVRQSLDELKQSDAGHELPVLDHTAALQGGQELFPDDSRPAAERHRRRTCRCRSRVVAAKPNRWRTSPGSSRGAPGVTDVKTPARFIEPFFRRRTACGRSTIFIGLSLTAGVGVPDRDDRAARHLRAEPRDRGDEARRRLELFVRVPFLAEGLVQGLIGAGFAFGLSSSPAACSTA